MNDIEKQIEETAKLFHDTYERLAPKYGYFTRIETREWNPESNNGKLMLAVVSELYHQLLLEERKRLIGVVEGMKMDETRRTHAPITRGGWNAALTALLSTLNKEKD